MQTVALIVGVIFTTFSFFVTADEHENYYLSEDNTIGTRREGEYYDAYPVPAYTSGVSTADEKQGIDETAMVAAIPGIAALLGIMVLAWAQANDHQNQQNTIDDEKTKVSNICTAVTATGSTTLALSNGANTAQFATAATPTAAEVAARLNLIENAINAFQTPTCT